MKNRSTKLVLLALAATAAMTTLAASTAHAQRGIFIDGSGLTIRDRNGNTHTKSWSRILDPRTNVRKYEQPIIRNGVVVGTRWIGLDGKVHYDYNTPGPGGTIKTYSKFAPSQNPVVKPLPRSGGSSSNPFVIKKKSNLPQLCDPTPRPRWTFSNPRQLPKVHGLKSSHKSFRRPY